MASPAPAKLQPLHNFSLTHLKWKNHRSNRNRLAGEASSSSPPQSNPWTESPPLRSHNHTSQSNAHRRPSPELNADPNDAVSRTFRSNKISIRVKQNDAVPVTGETHQFTPIDDSVPPPPAASEDESSPKVWNLRPRRPPVNQKQSTGGSPAIGTSRLRDNKTSHEINNNKQSSELINNNNNNNSDLKKMKNQKFSIPLSRGEIEEDILLLTGSKPSRRPKKRPRAIQKQLDNLFPGLWLDSITADSYKVSETPSK